MQIEFETKAVLKKLTAAHKQLAEFKGTIKKPEAAHAEGDDCWRGRIGEIHAGALVGRADGPACRHLDQVHWMPHWTPRPSKEHLEMVRAFEKEEG